MIKPHPFKLMCKQCGWSKTFAPKSDVLIEGLNYLNSCPKCGNSELEHKSAGAVKGLVTTLFEQINRR